MKKATKRKKLDVSRYFRANGSKLSAEPKAVENWGTEEDDEDSENESGAPRPRRKSLEETIPNPLPANPVFQILRNRTLDYMKRKGATHIFFARCELSDALVQELIGDEGLKQLGLLLFNALTSGNVDFAKDVADAIKSAKAIYSTEECSQTFERFAVYQCEAEKRGEIKLWGSHKMLTTRSALKEGFQQYLMNLNCPSEINGKQWKAFLERAGLNHLPDGKPGPKAKLKRSSIK